MRSCTISRNSYKMNKNKNKKLKSPTLSPIPSPKNSIKSAQSDNVKDVLPTSDSNEEIISLLTERTSSFDYKEHILDKVNKRLDFGRKKYGHGIIINDNTKQYSSNWDQCSANNWLMMGYEEMLDGCVYLSAEIIRAQTNDSENKTYITKLEKALKNCIKTTDLLLTAENSK